jgi:hypothetical protein
VDHEDSSEAIQQKYWGVPGVAGGYDASSALSRADSELARPFRSA